MCQDGFPERKLHPTNSTIKRHQQLELHIPYQNNKKRNQKSQSGGSIEVRIFDLESAFDLNRFGGIGPWVGSGGRALGPEGRSCSSDSANGQPLRIRYLVGKIYC